MKVYEEDLVKILQRINNFRLDYNNVHKHKQFVCDGVQVGIVSEEVVKLLVDYPEVFTITATMLLFNADLTEFNQRTQALDFVLRDLREKGDVDCLRGWREECYEISQSFGSPPLFRIERAAAPVFGIRKYGVQVNGYVEDEVGNLHVWIQRRSSSKPTYPGKLDNFVSGGLTEGRGVLETAIKEAAEEAGLTTQLAAGLQACGTVSYMHQSERGIHPQTEYVFDISLPATFIPENTDGEVDEWFLCPVHQLINNLYSQEFKLTSIPTTLDFMIRHGYIDSETEVQLPTLVEMLHPPIHSFFSQE